MMSGDCQSQGLAEWLHSLGWSGSLQPSDLRKLNTPKMRSVWRHLQAHVRTPHIASTIRKNVLLAQMEEENIFVGQFCSFRLDSINQLDKVKEVLKIEEEKDKIKREIKMIDEKLQNEKSSLLQNIITEQWERQKLSETEDKTVILELKHAKLLKDCKKMNVDKETAVHLKSSKTSSSHNERNYQNSVVRKYVKDYRYPFKDSDDDSEYLCEMMASILDFKPDTILDGITKNVKEALRTLNSIGDISVRMGDSFSSMVTFQEKLRNLKIQMIRNEVNIQEYRKKISSESTELEKEKKELVDSFIKKDEDKTNLEKSSSSNESEEGNMDGCCKGSVEEEEEVNRGNNKYLSQLLDGVLRNIQEEKESDKIQKEINRLMPDDDFEILETLRRSVIGLTAKEEKLHIEVMKKVNEVNRVVSTIYGSLLDSGEVNELLAEILQLAADFKTETSQICKNSVDSDEFTDLVLKEVEVFQRIPMVALHRKWNTSDEMLGPLKFSNNSSLLYFLLQSEEKNSIVNVLMKYLWSLSINPQFY